MKAIFTLVLILASICVFTACRGQEAVPLDTPTMPAPTVAPTATPLSVMEYVEWCDVNTAYDTMAEVLNIDPTNSEDLATVTYGDMVEAFAGHVEVLRGVQPPHKLKAYHIALIGYFEALVKYNEGFAQEELVDWDATIGEAGDADELSVSVLAFGEELDKLSDTLSSDAAELIETRCFE